MQELRTVISPRDANHTFNGVCSRLVSTSIELAVVRSVVFGGEIGPFTAWWCLEERGSQRQAAASSEPWTSGRRWTLCAQGVAAPSEEFRAELDVPLVVPPGGQAWFYVHSALQHDRGIAYQSFSSRDSCVASDANLTMYPGAARLGDTPFGGNGFFRKNRGFAGALCYETERLPWSVMNHKLFPRSFRRCVFQMLLCHNSSEGLLRCLPFEVLLLILEQMYWRDFAVREDEEDEEEDDESIDDDTAHLRRSRRRHARGCFASCWAGLLRRLGIR